MKITIYGERIDRKYYTHLLYLEKQGKVELEFIGANVLYLLFAKLYGLGLLQFMKNKYVPEVPTFKDIFKSIFAFFILPFRACVVLSFEPYSNLIYYFTLLKKINKHLIFYTSWPYWFTSYRRRPFFIARRLWLHFFRGIPIICVSEAATQRLKDLGYESYAIPHPIDTEIFSPHKTKKDVVTILYVGRLVEEKGLRDLVTVYEALRKKYRIALVIAGEGPLKEYVQEKVAHGVRYLGYVRTAKALRDVYRAADIFVINSYKTHDWEEFFGITLLEAMACGLAVMSTDCIGPKELINDMCNGLLIHQRDSGGLRMKLELLIQDTALRTYLGKGARMTAQRYDVRKVSLQFLEILRRKL